MEAKRCTSPIASSSCGNIDTSNPSLIPCASIDTQEDANGDANDDVIDDESSDEEELASSDDDSDADDSDDDDDDSDEDVDTIQVKVAISTDEIRGFLIPVSKKGYDIVKKSLKRDYDHTSLDSLVYKDNDGDTIRIRSKNDFLYALNNHIDNDQRKSAIKFYTQTNDYYNSSGRSSSMGISNKSITNSPITSHRHAGESKHDTRYSLDAKEHKEGASTAHSVAVTNSSKTSSQRSDGNIIWQKGEMLGAGSFGIVYSGLNLKSGQRIAVKEMNFNNGSNSKMLMSQNKAIQREVQILSDLIEHKNIIRYFGTECYQNGIRIFLELAQSTIKDILNEYGSLAEPIVKRYCHGILSGLSFLHANGVIHRDIKSSNLLILNNTIKLADFGCSSIMEVSKDTTIQSYGTGNVAGTIVYMPPEFLSSEIMLTDESKTGNTPINAPAPAAAPAATTKYGKKSDIWSVGITLVEMSTGRMPFKSSAAAIFSLCVSKTYPSFPTFMSQLAHSFLQRCLLELPDARGSSDELLQDAWLSCYGDGGEDDLMIGSQYAYSAALDGSGGCDDNDSSLQCRPRTSSSSVSFAPYNVAKLCSSNNGLASSIANERVGSNESFNDSKSDFSAYFNHILDIENKKDAIATTTTSSAIGTVGSNDEEDAYCDDFEADD